MPAAVRLAFICRCGMWHVREWQWFGNQLKIVDVVLSPDSEYGRDWAGGIRPDTIPGIRRTGC